MGVMKKGPKKIFTKKVSKYCNSVRVINSLLIFKKSSTRAPYAALHPAIAALF
jgi:hypothetical protein